MSLKLCPKVIKKSDVLSPSILNLTNSSSVFENDFMFEGFKEIRS